MVARPWRIRWPAATLAAGLVLASGAAAGYAVTRPPSHDYGTVPAVGLPAAVPRAGPPTGVHRVAGPSLSGRPGTAAGRHGGLAGVAVTRVPVRLRIPAIGVNAAVIPVGVEAGGWLAIPPDPSHVGWWAGGGFPGEPTGAVILVGHIDSAASGPGALFRLEDVRPGQAVTVTAAGRAYRYRVAALRAYSKTNLPATAIFGQRVAARLVIISCGGPYDPATGHYADNIVAYAVPADGLRGR